MKIAVVADEDTVNCFKLAGVERAYSVVSAKEADRLIREISEEPDYALIITSDSLANRISATINEITEKKRYPLIVSIQDLEGTTQRVFDPITELIKRKTGIELKL